MSRPRRQRWSSEFFPWSSSFLLSPLYSLCYLSMCLMPTPSAAAATFLSPGTFLTPCADILSALRLLDFRWLSFAASCWHPLGC